MALQESGLYYPNKMARIYVLSIAETIGQKTMETVFKAAGVPASLNPPPNNLAKEFDFAYMGGLGATLEKMYGPRGERGLAVHAGRLSFAEGLAEFGPLLGISELAFKAIPLKAKAQIVLKAIAESFTKFSDMTVTITDTEEHFHYTVQDCPLCWGRTSQKGICYSGAGVIEEGLTWVSGGRQFQVVQIACHAGGDDRCIFQINKTPLS